MSVKTRPVPLGMIYIQQDNDNRKNRPTPLGMIVIADIDTTNGTGITGNAQISTIVISS